MEDRLRIITRVVGALSTNCYILINVNTKEAVIVDPGDDAKVIMQTISDEQAEPVAILLTHAHFDHMLAADEIKNQYNIPVYMGADEVSLASDANANLSDEFGCTCRLSADCTVNDSDTFELAGFLFETAATPGHTKGSVCYFLRSEKILLSGDTLFYESVGRTDFPTGSLRQLAASIQDRLMKLPNDTCVLPGHGEPTQIGWEKTNNPIMFYGAV